MMSVVPPDTKTLAKAVVLPTAALNVVVPVLVTINALAPSTVPVNVVFPVPSLTLKPAVSKLVPWIETLLLVVVSVAAGVMTTLL